MIISYGVLKLRINREIIINQSTESTGVSKPGKIVLNRGLRLFHLTLNSL